MAWALCEQDGWSPREHAAFWTALLPELPGRRSSVDLQSRVGAALVHDGLTHAEAEQVLNLSRRTIRAHEPDTPRRRPSLERGQRLMHEAMSGDLGDALLRMTGTRWIPGEALPRVWTDADEEPEGGHFNGLIEADWQPPGIEYPLAAENELRLRWHRRRLVYLLAAVLDARTRG